jgi:dihydropteroate synthase
VQNTAFSTNKTLNVRGSIVDLQTPKVMGILNITPDSFYSGSRLGGEQEILTRAEKMLKEGASFVDVGGYSSRPGAADITAEEEIQRVVPAIRALKKEFSALPVSVDTFRSSVATAAVLEGASLVNDISGGSLDELMFSTVAGLGVPYVMMHMKGNPQTMMQQASYKDLLKEVIDYFHEKVHKAAQSGIKDIVIDPGFGFSKTREHNFELLHELNLLKIVNRPLLVGLSRKSMVWKSLNIQPEDALNGTTVLNTIAVIKGADILRVHDVKEAMQAIALVRMLPRS